MSKHILVVEPANEVRNVIAALLESAGYRTSGADGGEEMLRLLSGEHDIDAIVLDSSLAGEQRKSLANYAEQIRLPVVMISGRPAAMRHAQEESLQLLWKPLPRRSFFPHWTGHSQAVSSGSVDRARASSPMPRNLILPSSAA